MTQVSEPAALGKEKKMNEKNKNKTLSNVTVPPRAQSSCLWASWTLGSRRHAHGADSRSDSPHFVLSG